METREDRWFVRFRGHTLGPLTTDQVRKSLRQKELSPYDKVASTKNPVWRPLEEMADLFEYWGSPSPQKLTALPSPQYLWKKKRAPVPIPVAPVKSSAGPLAEALRAPTPEKIPEPVVEATPKPKVEVAAPVASPMPAPAQKPVPIAPPIAISVAPVTKPVTPVTEPVTPTPAPAALNPVPVAPIPTPAVSPIALNPLLSARALPKKPKGKKAKLKAEKKPAPTAAAGATASPEEAKLAQDTLSLLESLRRWGEQEQKLYVNSPSAPPAPPSPSSEEAPLPVAAQTTAPASPTLVETATGTLPPRPEILFTNWVPPAAEFVPVIRPRKIEFHFNVSKPFMVLCTGLVIAALVATFAYTTNKMRGLESLRLPDPSSPTYQPSDESDPTPALKAPTRPKRD